MNHFQGPRRAFRSGRFVISALPFFLSSIFPAIAQDQPAKPVPVEKQVQRKQAIPAAKLEPHSETVQEHYSAAETFQLVGDFKNAETEYRRVISLSLQQFAALRVLAQDQQQALIYLQFAVSSDPSDTQAQLGLASVYFRLGKFADAKSMLQSVLAKDEHQLAAKNLLGKILFMDGDYQAAAEHLKASLTESSDLDVAYSLALTYLKSGKLAEATNVFDEMLTSLGSSAELHVLIGRAYQYGNQFDLATAEFRKALELNPAAERAHPYLGTVYLLQKGDAALSDARREFEAEISHNPADYSSHFYLGVVYFKQHEFKPAENELSTAVKLQPENPDAYFYLGQAQFERGHTQTSVAQFEKAIQLYGSASPNAQPAHEALSKALENLGRHADAQRELDIARGLERSAGQPLPDVFSSYASSGNEVRSILLPPARTANPPKIPDAYLVSLREALGNAYHNLGVIHAQDSDYLEASQLFAEAAKWTPDIKALDRNWGTASFRANQYKSAIPPLERHVHADPQDSNARQMLALSYFMTEDFPKAAETFRPLVSSLPNNPSLLYAAGISLAKTGDSQGASEIFRRMLVQNPDAAEVHLFLGQAHADQKEDAEALQEFSRALELNPKLPEANFGSGLIYLRQGKMELAEKQFRAELLVNPGDVSAEYRLGYVLAAQQRPAEAIELFADVVRQKPNDADAHYELGKALLEKGELKPATERLETAIRLAPDQPYAYYQLSLAYRRQGRAPEAEATLHQYETVKQKKSPGKNESSSDKRQSN